NTLKTRGENFDFCFFQIRLNRSETFKRSINQYPILIFKNLIQPVIYKFQFKFLNILSFRVNAKVTAMVEHERHRTGSSKTAIAFVEITADIGNSSGIVICGRFY